MGAKVIFERDIEIPMRDGCVLKGDLLLIAKVSLKPLACPALVVTSALVSASITGCGAGTGTVGPIRSVR